MKRTVVREGGRWVRAVIYSVVVGRSKYVFVLMPMRWLGSVGVGIVGAWVMRGGIIVGGGGW